MTPDPRLHPRGSRVAKWLLARLGWRVRFAGLPGPRGVIIVYPHTSNVDFLIGLLAKWSMGITISFWGKHTLFDVPLFGRWMRHIGGIPVRRDAPGDLVEQTAAHFADTDMLWLALAPEGTRSYRDHWRSGFYRLACGLSLPVGLAYFDYRRREVVLTEFIALSGERDADLARIGAYYADRAHGYAPERAAPVRLRALD